MEIEKEEDNINVDNLDNLELFPHQHEYCPDCGQCLICQHPKADENDTRMGHSPCLSSTQSLSLSTAQPQKSHSATPSPSMKRKPRSEWPDNPSSLKRSSSAGFNCNQQPSTSQNQQPSTSQRHSNNNGVFWTIKNIVENVEDNTNVPPKGIIVAVDDILKSMKADKSLFKPPKIKHSGPQEVVTLSDNDSSNSSHLCQRQTEKPKKVG
jgi:hypothetical protein